MSKQARQTKKDRKPRASENGAPAAAPLEDTEMSKDLTQYVTTKRAAEMLGVDPDHVNHLLRVGKLRGNKLGGWSWLVYVPSIENYHNHKSTKGRPTSREPELQTTN